MKLSDLFKSAPQRWGYATWCDPSVGYLYVETPKAACTKIKLTLQALSGFPPPEKTVQIHYREGDQFVGSALDYVDEIDRLVSSGDLYCFSFVREPVDRFVSAFIDKIVLSRGPFWERYRTQIRETCNLLPQDEIRIGHFLDWVERTPDDQRDIHWRSQSRLLRRDVIPYQLIGHQEQFENDFARVLTALEASDPRGMAQGRENSRSARLSVEPSEGELGRIAEIYSDDYTVFGYTRA